MVEVGLTAALALARRGIPVIAGFKPRKHTSRKGWLARFDCFPRNPFATDPNVADWLQRDGRTLGVREMARLVRPGGAVVVTMAALEMLRGDHSESWQEVRRYTPDTARALFVQAGLRVERVSFLFGSLFPLMLTVRGVQRLLRPFRAHRPDTDIAVPSPPINELLTALVTAEARIAGRFSLPVGSSLLVVGKKPER